MTDGVIFDIKRFAIHDGPGIRTTVFFKGCPLRCAWCHNPESQAFGVETLQGRNGPLSVGRQVSVDEVMEDVKRDTSFYDESGGGVTFSGGSPLAQHEFLIALLDRCAKLDIHRTVDTCGCAPADILRDVARRTDLFLYDLKLVDNECHLQYTGVGTDKIQGNLRLLCDAGIPIEVRIPVIPGISDTVANLEALGCFLHSLSRPLPLRLIPYHRAARDKYARFGFTTLLPDIPEPTGEEMARLRANLRNRGLDVQE